MRSLRSGLDSIEVRAFGGQARQACSLISLFEQIAREEQWQPGTALHDFIDRSVYLAATKGEEIVGGIQLVLASDAQWWPSRTVWPECDSGLSSATAHVLIMAVDKQYRGNPTLFTKLCISLHLLCLKLGIEEVRLECTPATFRIYERVGMQLELIGPGRVHWGEDCLPARISVPRFTAASNLREQSSPSYKALVEQVTSTLNLDCPDHSCNHGAEANL